MSTKLRATIADYTMQCRAKKLDPQTIRWYTQNLTTIVDGLEAEGALTVDDLSVPTLNGVLADLHNGSRSDMTVRGYFQVLLGWLTYLEDEELIGSSLRRRIRKNKPQAARDG
jgi:site-specific recombinase XerD